MEVMEAARIQPAWSQRKIQQLADLRWLSNSQQTAGFLDDAKFLLIFEADPLAQVRVIKHGMSPAIVEQIAERMHVSKDKLLTTLGLARATVQRKTSRRKPLSADESSRVLGISRLIGQVRALVEQSGDASGFDAARWVAGWLDQPLPALSGIAPAQLMDTAEGQAIVAQVVARMQSGVYA